MIEDEIKKLTDEIFNKNQKHLEEEVEKYTEYERKYNELVKEVCKKHAKKLNNVINTLDYLAKTYKLNSKILNDSVYNILLDFAYPKSDVSKIILGYNQDKNEYRVVYVEYKSILMSFLHDSYYESRDKIEIESRALSEFNDEHYVSTVQDYKDRDEVYKQSYEDLLELTSLDENNEHSYLSLLPRIKKALEEANNNC